MLKDLQFCGFKEFIFFFFYLFAGLRFALVCLNVVGVKDTNALIGRGDWGSLSHP